MLVAMRTEILPKPIKRVMKRWQGRWFSVANTSRDPHQCAPQVQAAIPDHSPSCIVRTAYHLKFQWILLRLPKCEHNDSTKGLIQKMKESRVRKRIAHAKRKARPELKSHEWDQLHYSKTLLSSIDLFNGDNIERIDGSHLNADEFIKLYETRHIPIILTGITDSWRANTKWTLNVSAENIWINSYVCESRNISSLCYIN
uniref:Cupin_8 domain-containing protein n=1 Tax=Ascaris lumbricoides TaxID=6252 RepID=A0A0M3HL24_ASCLU